MFKCAVTGLLTAPREPLTRVVVETRVKQYWSKDGSTLLGTGFETVKEINVSPRGLAIIAAAKAADEALDPKVEDHAPSSPLGGLGSRARGHYFDDRPYALQHGASQRVH